MSKRSLLGICVLLLFSLTSNAQLFRFLARASASQVAAGDTLLYTILVTNNDTFVVNFTVTDTLPSGVTLLAATNNPPGTVSSNGSVVTFTQQLGFGIVGTNTVSVLVNSNASGTLNSAISVTAPSGTQTTNLVTTVTATNIGQASVQATIKSEPQNAYVDDRIVFTVLLTNKGTVAAQNLIITNQFSTNVLLRSASPSNLVSTFNGTSLVLGLGSLDSMSTETATFVLQPTNAGTLITTTTLSGSNSASASPSVMITNTVSIPDTNQLQVTAGAQVFDQQTGLFRQVVQVSNTSTSDVTSVRVVVMGLGTNQLFNAIGTNSTNGFVVFGAPLPAGATTNIVLEYFVRSRTPVEGLTFVAYEANATAPTGTATGEPPNITQIHFFAPDRLLIEFTSELGASYKILYSDNSSFSNAHFAQPSIIAPADKTQWIDEGPPKTISPLTETTNRFYRVIKQ